MYESRDSNKALWGSIPNENFPVQISWFHNWDACWGFKMRTVDLLTKNLSNLGCNGAEDCFCFPVLFLIA